MDELRLREGRESKSYLMIASLANYKANPTYNAVDNKNTIKKFLVDPVRLAPYTTPPLFSAKSLTFSIKVVGVSMVKKAANSIGSSMHGHGLSHSLGDRRPNIKKLNDTPKKAKPKYHHTSSENGSINENVAGEPSSVTPSLRSVQLRGSAFKEICLVVSAINCKASYVNAISTVMGQEPFEIPHINLQSTGIAFPPASAARLKEMERNN
uniref:Uncharacterized protein n=1 Tax=Glossina austeni TaxID=7395 RepID=A0A1A9VGY9_GLOAU